MNGTEAAYAIVVELATRPTWPEPFWDGTPAGVADQLDQLVNQLNLILWDADQAFTSEHGAQHVLRLVEVARETAARLRGVPNSVRRVATDPERDALTRILTPFTRQATVTVQDLERLHPFQLRREPAPPIRVELPDA